MSYQDGDSKCQALSPGPKPEVSVALEAGEERTSLPSRESEGKEKCSCHDVLATATAVCATNSTTTLSSSYRVDMVAEQRSAGWEVVQLTQCPIGIVIRIVIRIVIGITRNLMTFKKDDQNL